MNKRVLLLFIVLILSASLGCIFRKNMIGGVYLTAHLFEKPSFEDNPQMAGTVNTIQEVNNEISSFIWIQNLSISDSQAIDNLESLSQLKDLSHLEMFQDAPVRKEQIAQLEKCLPNCEIILNGTPLMQQ